MTTKTVGPQRPQRPHNPTRLTFPSTVSLPPLSPPSPTPAPVFQTHNSVPIGKLKYPLQDIVIDFCYPDNELLKLISTDEIRTSSLTSTARPPPLSAIIVTPHSEPGIRSKARLFENDIRLEQEEEKDFYDEYYDYYDQITEQENKLEQDRASQSPERFSSRPELSSFPPPEERFAAIPQTDTSAFRKGSVTC